MKIERITTSELNKVLEQINEFYHVGIKHDFETGLKCEEFELSDMYIFPYYMDGTVEINANISYDNDECFGGFDIEEVEMEIEDFILINEEEDIVYLLDKDHKKRLAERIKEFIIVELV